MICNCCMEEFSVKKKKSGQIIIVLFLLLCCFALIYLIGWNFIGSRKIKLSINESQKQQIAEKYGFTQMLSDDIVSFQEISYNRKYVNVLILSKNEQTEKIIKSNSHIQKTEKLKLFAFPYPNARYIPHQVKECCCFFDKNYYYLSVFTKGSDYNRGINDLFWEIYKIQNLD